ncbi:MAG TPA: RNA-binding S4 domain-containing protein [Anaerolineae bacterium]|nr:RNA-binding S4 domain-containing protein [Anaerolineae bacterium]
MTNENYIKLDSFMKWQNLVDTGGQAKIVIQNGEVKVNGQNETRRGRKLIDGDKVTYNGKTIVVRLGEK